MSKLFDSEFLQKLEQLALISRRANHGQMLAQRTTAATGSGLEFADHQPYAEGDDFRYLDWNVFARHGELLLKRFHEERDLHIDLLLDCSPSMDSGGAYPKFDYAKRVTGSLAYMALTHLDRVTLTTFADTALKRNKTLRGHHQMIPLMQQLERLTTTGTNTRLEAAAESICQPGRARGLVVMISDFFDRKGFQRAVDKLRHHQFEVYLVQLFAPNEALPDIRGDVELVDIETQQSRHVTIRARDVKRYHAMFQEFLATIQSYARQNGVGYIGVSTDVSVEILLLRMMRKAGWLLGPSS